MDRGEPYLSCSASPPTGLYQPTRGFGAIWCRLGAAGGAIGWGLDSERGFGFGNGDPLVQNFEHGAILRGSDGLSRGLAYVLYDDGTFVRVSH